MTQKYGPFAAGAGASLGQDDYLDGLGPMLQGDGVNTTTYGDSTLQVYGNSSGMLVLMRAGTAMSRGAYYSNSADVSLAIAASTTSPRIDRVVLRNDRGHSGGGQIYPFVITGTAASVPIAPAITQTPGGTWDFPLAQVAIPASASGIVPGNVSDERQYLPLHFGVCDTSRPYSTPPVNGSAGRVFYDNNPAVLDVIATNGSTWQAVRGWWNTDSGTQALGLAGGAFTGTATYRQLGRIVFLDGAVTATSDSLGMLALPPSVAPVAPKNFPIGSNGLTINPVTGPGGDYTIPVYPVWNLAVPRSADATTTPVALSIQDGRSPNGTAFEFHVSYPLG